MFLKHQLNPAPLAIMLAAVCLLFLSACDSGAKSRLDGDSLYLPKSALLVRMYESIGTNEHPPYLRFDGSYPKDWPRDFKLPEGTRVEKGHKLEPQDPLDPQMSTPGTKRAVFTALAPGQPADVIAFFKEQIGKQGLSLEKDQVNAGGETPEFGKSPGTHELASKWDSDKFIQTISVKVMLDADLDGYTMYTVNMVVKP